MINKRLCIVGLGLMGGSLAKALKGQTQQLIGVDQHAGTRQMALAGRTFDFVTDNLASGLETADLVILATPVHTILEILAELPHLRPHGCLLMDLGSTKEEICAAMSSLPDTFAAVGGHPMCGKETAGYQAADAELFRGHTFVLSRTSRTNPQIEELSLSLIEHIGAKALFLPADEHDQLVAIASHLPYLLSAALMHRAVDTGDERIWPVSASGFRDTTRLAGSDPRMMLDILLTNKTAVLSQLLHYEEDLQGLIRLLKNGDEAELYGWLETAQQAYVDYRRQKTDSV